MTSPSPVNRDHQPSNDWATEHGKAVRGYLFAMVRRIDIADDLAQEVFVRAWEARDRYREQGSARAYLLQIAHRLLCDRGRRAGREINLDDEDWKQLEPASPTVEPVAAVLRQEAVDRLCEALDSLSPQQQQVLLLRYYGQLSFAEIAQMIDCPINTTLSHCQRGLKKLRKLLVENAS